MVWEGDDGSVRSWSYGALNKMLGRRLKRTPALTLETAAAVLLDAPPSAVESRELAERCGVGERTRVAWMGPADHPLFAWLLAASMQLGATMILYGGERIWQVAARQSAQILALPGPLETAPPDLIDLQMVITARGNDAAHFDITWRL